MKRPADLPIVAKKSEYWCPVHGQVPLAPDGKPEHVRIEIAGAVTMHCILCLGEWQAAMQQQIRFQVTRIVRQVPTFPPNESRGIELLSGGRA